MGCTLNKTAAENGKDRGASVRASGTLLTDRFKPSYGSKKGKAPARNRGKAGKVRGWFQGEEESESSGSDGAEAFLSKEDVRLLSKSLQRHFLFSTLDVEEQTSIIRRMKRRLIERESAVCRQGDEADCLYVVGTGTFDVVIDGEKVKQLKRGNLFGDLALLYNVRRTASVINALSTPCTVWQLDAGVVSSTLRKLQQRNLNRIVTFLSDEKSPFKKLTADEQSALAHVSTIQEYNQGDDILREGEVSEWMFVVMEGRVLVKDVYGNLHTAREYEFLGSVYNAHQVTSAKAPEKVTLLSFGKQQLQKLYGMGVDTILKQAVLKGALGGSELFQSLSPEQQTALLATFEENQLSAGQTVISKNSTAQIVVVLNGSISVQCETAGQPAELILAGREYGVSRLWSGEPMPAEVVAGSDSVTLYRTSLARVECALLDAGTVSLEELVSRNNIAGVLREIFLFKSMPPGAVDQVARALTQKRLQPKETLFKEGDPSTQFFLIKTGTIDVRKKFPDGERSIRNLGRWDYLGERGLLLNEPRSATCQAMDEGAVIFSLEKADFLKIVGNFRPVLEKRMKLQDSDIQLKDLKPLFIVGKGSFGVVKLCGHVKHPKDASKVYALKCIDKSRAVQNKQQQSLKIERDINAQCFHPCIVQFIKTLQDKNTIYFLTEFLGGGDLFLGIREIGMLDKKQSQFFAGSILLGLEYLHERKIIYRDLKPENVLLDFEGRAKLVDFGCCHQGLRAYTIVGTPEYLAPEVILTKGYSNIVDFWSLGVVIYEFVCGPLPFGSDEGGDGSQMELFRQILEAVIRIPDYVKDQSAIHLLHALLEKVPELRLGATLAHAEEIKKHEYFAGFDWDACAGGYAVAPWKPNEAALKSSWTPAQEDEESDWDVSSQGTGGEKPEVWLEGF